MIECPRRPASTSIFDFFCLLLMLAPLLILPWYSLGYDRFAIPKETAIQVGIYGLSVAFVLRHRTFAIDALDVCLLAIVVHGVVSTFHSVNVWTAFRSWSSSTSHVIAFWVARQLSKQEVSKEVTGRPMRDVDRAELVMLSLSLSALLISVSVILESAGLISALSMTGRGPGGVLGNRNFAAHFIAAGIPMLVTALTLKPDRRVQVMAVVGLFPMIVAIVLTRCRAAWLGAFVGLVVTVSLAVAVRPVRFALRGACLIAAAVVASVLICQLPPWASLWSAKRPYAVTASRLFEYESGTGRGRLEQYQRAINLGGARPLLGFGPGNWPVAYALSTQGHGVDSNFDGRSPQPVNRLPNSDVFGVLAERGILGLLGLALAVGLYIKTLVGRTTRPDAFFVVTALGVLSVVFVVGILDAFVLRPEGGLLVAGVLGACLGRGPSRPLVTLQRSPVLVALGIVALCGSVQQVARLAVSPLLASSDPTLVKRALKFDPGNFVKASLAADSFSKRGDCQSANEMARRARGWCPVSPYLDRALTDCKFVGQ